MSAVALLLLGDQAAHVGSGAAMTLLIPVLLWAVALVVWWLLFRRQTRR
ncbi:MAG: hypothetical protein M3076_13320 [Actinomycetota bacterium]|nr:hypothetical protein [Actinomycetota bacterium]